MHQHQAVAFHDLIDDAVHAAAGAPQPLQLVPQRLANVPRAVRYRPVDCFKRCFPDRGGKPVEVALGLGQ